MIIQNLIWSKVTVKNEIGDVIAALANVTARFKKGDLIHFKQYTFSQGTSTGRQLNYSYPELLSMSISGITLKAFEWGNTNKDAPVIIELEF